MSSSFPPNRQSGPSRQRISYKRWLRTWYGDVWAPDGETAEEVRSRTEAFWATDPLQRLIDYPWSLYLDPGLSDRPRYEVRFKEEREAAGDIVVALPGGAGWLLAHPGTPQLRIDLAVAQMAASRGLVKTYPEWRELIGRDWPTNAAGQEIARQRHAAYWATTDDPMFRALAPPRYFQAGWRSVRTTHDETENGPLAQWEAEFMQERTKLGDTVVGHSVFAIGTPAARVDHIMELLRADAPWTEPAVDRGGRGKGRSGDHGRA